MLTSHEAAIRMTSPRGILLHGEVGVGKSMLLDLLADGLPHAKKRRWHFHNFMLESLSFLETHRKSLSNVASYPNSPAVEKDIGNGEEYSLLWMAKDMMEHSPILFLDEFQLPDRAASKILSGLLTIFFQLGGVLIASSNRLPEQLGRGSGIALAPSNGGMRRWLGLGSRGRFGGGGDDEYRGFVEVLKARCEVWEMRDGRDWRRREAEEDVNERDVHAEAILATTKSQTPSKQNLMVRGVRSQESMSHQILDIENGEKAETKSERAVLPKKYLLCSDSVEQRNEEAWNTLIRSVLPSSTPTPTPWHQSKLTVYGRTLYLLQTFSGVLYASFSSLCNALYGPADYITLASTFHTLILDQVPVLNLSQKNEARRFITLLDALYEARCKATHQSRGRTGWDILP